MALPAVSRKLFSAPRLPLVARALALTLLLSVAGSLGVYLYRHKSAAVVSPDEPVLGGEVTGIFENFRHLETEGGKDKYLITAAVDKAYANGAHELTKVELLSFGAASDRKDRVTSDRAAYDPNKAVMVFESAVNVETSDGLKVQAETLRYHQETGVVEVEGPTKYARRNLTGTCTGAVLETNVERLRMIKDVDMTFHSADDAPEAKDPVTGAAPAAAQPAAAKAEGGKKGGKGHGGKGGHGGGKKKRAAAAAAAAAAAGGAPVAAASDADGPADFSKGPRIPVRVRAGTALFDKKSGVVRYESGAVATRAADELRGATLVAYVTQDNRVERVEARGDAYLKASGRAESSAPSMDFFFAEGNQLQKAIGTGGARLHWLGGAPDRNVTGDRIEMDMGPSAQGAELRQALVNGQGVVTMAAPAATEARANPAARELRADAIDLRMHPGGQFARKVTAEGKAVMTVTPTKAEAGVDRKRVTAPKMQMAFFDADNLAREYTAEGGVKVDFEPLAQDGRLPRATTSQSARAVFVRESQDVERLEQSGDFKYVEGEKNAVAQSAVYTQSSDLLELRGGRPTVWDAKARTQADEIDMRSKAGTHEGRGDVRTTYYSPQAAGNAVPFGNTKSPVFLTAAKVDADQGNGGTAVYTGGARAWQDDNYVKGETIRLFDADKRMEAEGGVESALYQTRRKGEGGAAEAVPVFTTASRMRYSDVERTVHYEGGVTSRQAPDVLVSETQDVWLSKTGASEVDHMIAAGGVVLTEPGRKGTGDRLVYTAADQKAVLTGSSARVEDAAQGTSTGAELTYFVGGDRVRSTGQGAGRVKTTRHIRKEGQ